MVLRKLGTDDPATRSADMQWGIELAASDERVVNILQNSLEDEDDLRFAGIVTILRAVGRFDPPPNADIHDRLHWVALSTSSPSAHASRRLFLHDMIRGGRDNVHVRRGLNFCQTTPPCVRRRQFSRQDLKIGPCCQTCRMIATPVFEARQHWLRGSPVRRFSRQLLRGNSTRNKTLRLLPTCDMPLCCSLRPNLPTFWAMQPRPPGFSAMNKRSTRRCIRL